MMKDLKVTLHFSEKIHKEFFLDCLTKERLNSRTRKNQVKDLINHYRIDEVSELDGSVHYSNHKEIELMTDEYRDKFFKKMIDDSAQRIQNQFIEQLKDEFLSGNYLKDAITKQIRHAFDASLLELRIKQLQEEN